MMNLLLAILPEQYLVLVIAGLGIAVILHLISIRKALGILAIICFLWVSGPFFEALFDSLSTTIQMAIVIAFGFVLIRWLSNLFLGRRITDYLLARFIYDLIRAPFRILGWLVQGFRRP